MEKTTIEHRVSEWVRCNLGEDFIFRPHQKEICIDTIYNIVEERENHNMVYEMPTGFGKTIFGIICAGVLWDYYEMESYILASDLFLWQQYIDTIRRYPEVYKKFGYIKGQIGNYRCDQNGEDIKNAYCRMCGMSWGKLMSTNPEFMCAKDCEYIKMRHKALRSHCTITTYQLFLYNVASSSGDEKDHTTFGHRPVIFCDECHNIPSIIQTKMTSIISPKDFDMILGIYDYAYGHTAMFVNDKENSPQYDIMGKYPTKSDLYDALMDIWSRLTDTKSIPAADYDDLIRYSEILGMMDSPASDIQMMCIEKKQNHKPFSSDDKNLFKLSSELKNYTCNFTTLMATIENAGLEYLVKQVTHTGEFGETVTISCAREDMMIYQNLLAHADWKVMYSATVGGHDAFDENCGMKYTEDGKSKFISVDSSFDFSSSPIIFLDRYRMTFKEKETSFRELEPIIYNTCKLNKDTKGMIQTGSYDNAERLYRDAPAEVRSRMLLYRGSREKDSMIRIHRGSKDTILVGPTLCEGVDLPDDDCRFIIIMKMPYPNLKDKMVDAKIRLFPLWYESTTSNAIIQGIGRGVRNDTDWCRTYIYDACFYRLYTDTMDQYPKYLRDRIKMYK